jgi:hypothetical protein
MRVLDLTVASGQPSVAIEIGTPMASAHEPTMNAKYNRDANLLGDTITSKLPSGTYDRLMVSLLGREIDTLRAHLGVDKATLAALYDAWIVFRERINLPCEPNPWK